jgi:hypothetical protein
MPQWAMPLIAFAEGQQPAAALSSTMPEWAWSLITLFCGAAGLAVGYMLGFRNGCVTGELRALHVTIAQMRERRRSRRHHDEPETADRLD